MKIIVNHKVVAEVVGDTLRKKIKGSKHLLRIPPAISFDLKSFHDAYKAGAKNVAVTDVETGDTYMASMLDVYAEGHIIDRGYGKQIYLDLDKWTKVVTEQTVQKALFI